MGPMGAWDFSVDFSFNRRPTPKEPPRKRPGSELSAGTRGRLAPDLNLMIRRRWIRVSMDHVHGPRWWFQILYVLMFIPKIGELIPI